MMPKQASIAERISVRVATTTDRRSFMRKTAGFAFKTVAVLAAGGAISEAFVAPAWADCGGAAGKGCPTISSGGKTLSLGCGPSRCCTDTSGINSGCNCSNGSGGCKNNGGRCLGAVARRRERMPERYRLLNLCGEYSFG
jgi:hypothetical protein